jgi:exodeoxyribonuclease VII large subunit
MSEPTPNPYTVSSLTASLKATLEGRFTRIYVEAEISGWKRYPSGHAYFTLKDAGAQISAVMFSSSFDRCRAKAGLKDGAKVLVYGSVSVYPPRGNYQLTVLAAKLVGEGDLMQRYLELKARLEAEGIFAAARKRPLPFLPRRIGIVTSEAGAVIHDMCTVLTRRFPNIEIRLFPALVQGAEAPRTLIAGIEHFNAAADGWRADVLVVARGGGSFEDLYCFNDEALVRALAASRLPTVSAVGHETDYTLCDFAADVRAGTPSIAAEILVPRRDELTARLDALAAQLARALSARGEWFAQRVDHLTESLAGALATAQAQAASRLDAAARQLVPSVRHAVSQSGLRLASACIRLEPAFAHAFDRVETRLARVREKLDLLSPYGVLARGYSLTTDASGAIVRAAAALKPGDRLVTRLADGTVESVVRETGG